MLICWRYGAMEGFVMWSIVQCKEASTRVSIASFFLGPKEAAVEAPPELVDSENPRQFVPFTYEDYRKLILSINLHAGEWWSPPICTLPFMIYWHAMYIHSLYTYLPPHPIVMIYKSRYKTNFTIFFLS